MRLLCVLVILVAFSFGSSDYLCYDAFWWRGEICTPSILPSQDAEWHYVLEVILISDNMWPDYWVGTQIKQGWQMP